MPKGVAKAGKRKCSPRVARVAITCERCGTAREFLPSQAAQRSGRFCSKACSAAVITARADSWTETKCGTCDTTFKKRTDHLKPVNYCSRACSASAKIVDGAKWRDPAQIKSYMQNYVIENRGRLNRLAQARKKANREHENKRQRERRARIPAKYFRVIDWESIKARYGHRCLCCGREDLKLEVDHVISLAAGGLHVKGNIQPLCRTCNARKGAKTTDYRLKKKLVLALTGIEIRET